MGSGGDAAGTRPPLSTEGNEADGDDDDCAEDDNEAEDGKTGRDASVFVFGDHEAADRSAGGGAEEAGSCEWC